MSLIDRLRLAASSTDSIDGDSSDDQDTPATQTPFGGGPAQGPAAPASYPPDYSQQPPPYGQFSYPAPVPTNGLAVASLVLGILWLWWIGSILALLLGYAARRQIFASNGAEGGDGLALAGIVLGWIGAATLTMLALAWMGA